MFKVIGLFALPLFFLQSAVHADVDPRYYAVIANARVQSSPPQITLQWEADGNATGYTISRRSGDSWNSIGTVGGSATSWTDSNVSNGGTYEYRIVKSSSAGYSGTGFVLAGINAPLKDSRGKVILLVDKTYSDALSAELARLQWDLAGDGWTVLRHDVSRNDSVPNIKNIIKSDYNSDPSNVKAAFLFGHIPVPYSGSLNPDGHPDHLGAWPTDVYYGDMDGSWTDSSVSATGANKPWNHNTPGDGKFDQNNLPSPVEIGVGRVDFYNMTCFANKTPSRSELDLLRAYLNKDHNFRHRVFTVARRGLICDNFGSVYGEAFASSGWRNFGSFFGAENVKAVGYGQYFPTLASEDYLWSYGDGGGSWYTCNGIGGSDDFATTDIKSVFTMFLGSYFGDWDNESNFMRASLGSGYCLTTSWAGRPHWFYHQMALGETIGSSTIASQNNVYGAAFSGPNAYSGLIHVGLLGDPTLRMHPVIPVSNLQGKASGSSMNLTWNASGDNNIQGYHVYKGSGPSGSFVRLTGSPIGATSFTDSTYSAGAVYMVRAIKLEAAGSGTYYNASQGAFYPQNASVAGGGGVGTLPETPATPANLAASYTSGSQVSLSWEDKSGNETGFRIDRKAGSGGVWAQVAQAAVNATGYSDGGLSPGTTYYYRVFAVNGAGASMPSNESSVTTPVPNATAAAALFAGTDAKTSGNWKGTYGTDGYNVITGSSAYPGYVKANNSGGITYQWSDYTQEARALQTGNGSARVSGCWFAPNAFNVDLNFLDGASHKLSLYFCDWDRLGRTEKVEILDASTGAVLDTRTVSNFESGIYLSWNVKGMVKVRLTSTNGANVVLAGLFFDAGQAIPSGAGSSTKAAGIVSGEFQLQITGQPGDKFDIYCTENLSAWTKISTVTLTGETYNFLDTTSQGKALRFYRAVAAP